MGRYSLNCTWKPWAFFSGRHSWEGGGHKQRVLLIMVVSLRETSTGSEHRTWGASEVGAAKNHKGAGFANVTKGWGGSQSHRRWKTHSLHTP